MDGFESVDDDSIAQFHAQGFLAFQHAFSNERVADAMAAVGDLIDGQNDEFRGVQYERIMAVPLEPGGVLLWHGRLHHGSPANLSDRRRQALQLHYVPESVDTIPSEERLAVYGSDGKDVTC